jgi:ribonuclease BN (tRNA processing enzyme)
MELVVLGSGTAIPSARRGSPAYLVRSKELSVLVDCGPGAIREAAAAGTGPGDIDLVLLTHFHPDHTLDLQALFFALRNPFFSGRGPLTILAPTGFGEVLSHWFSGPQGTWLEPRDYHLELIEVEPGVHEFRHLTLEAVRVEHTPQSLAWRIREDPEGKVLALSGDTRVCDGAVKAGLGADLYVLECAVPADEPLPFHLTPALAGEIARKANPRRVLLSHFYPPVDVELAALTVRDSFPGEVLVAEDQATYRI